MTFSNELYNKINKIYSISENKIAKKLLRIYRHGDVTPSRDVQYLDISKDNNRKVSYITQEVLNKFPNWQHDIDDYRVGDWYKEKKIKKIARKYVYFEDYSRILKTSIGGQQYCWQPRIRYHTSIAKILIWLFGDIFSEKERGEFISLWYADTLNIDESLIKIDSEVAKWYHEDMMFDTSGELGSSCMRYDKCQQYLEFYDENSVCKIVVLLSKCGKVKARTILWDDKYFDRIYGNSNELQDYLRVYLKGKGYHDIYNEYKEVTLELEVGYNDRSTFPYCDTMNHLYGKTLSNHGDYDIRLNSNEYGNTDNSECNGCGYETNDLRYCEDTGNDRCSDCSVYADIGQYEGNYIQNYVYLENGNYCHESEYVNINGNSYYEEECVEDYKGSMQLITNCVYSDYLNEYILREESVYSKAEQRYLVKEDAYYCNKLQDYLTEEPETV